MTLLQRAQCASALCLSLGLTLPTSAWSSGFTTTTDSWDQPDSVREAYHVIQANPGVQGLLKEGTGSLNFSQQVNGATGILTTKFQHYYKDLRVIGSVAFHHRGFKGDQIRNSLARFDLETNPTLDAATAVAIAKSYSDEFAELKKTPELKILPNHQGSAKLIYWIELEGKFQYGSQDFLINAHSGELVAILPHNYSIAPIQVYSARNQGKKVTPRIEKDPVTGKYKLKDCELSDLAGAPSTTLATDACILLYKGLSPLTAGQCQIIDGMDGSLLDMDAKSCTGTEADSSSLAAKENSKLALEYYLDHQGRNSFDNLGSTLNSIVHAGEKLANAFWITDQKVMVYGDGDGISMGDLTRSTDVAGHEFTHGVTGSTANLMMQGESGALNEAFSDYFGKLIENQGNWVVGKNLFSPGSGRIGLRDLEKPENITDTLLDPQGNRITRPYPSNKKDAALTGTAPCGPSNDYCWVHFNSTIPGHASYLIHQALGARKAELLLYTTLTQNLKETDDFKSTANAVLTTCSQMNLAKGDCDAVKMVYESVGIL